MIQKINFRLIAQTCDFSVDVAPISRKQLKNIYIPQRSGNWDVKK